MEAIASLAQLINYFIYLGFIGGWVGGWVGGEGGGGGGGGGDDR